VPNVLYLNFTGELVKETERNNDVDAFSFVTGSGPASLSVKPWIMPAGTLGGNVDILLELYDEGGGLLLNDDIFPGLLDRTADCRARPVERHTRHSPLFAKENPRPCRRTVRCDPLRRDAVRHPCIALDAHQAVAAIESGGDAELDERGIGCDRERESVEGMFRARR